MITQSVLDLSRYNGAITVRNPATGNHATYRISTVLKGGLKGSRIVSLLIGSNNETDYRGFGFIDPYGVVSLWNKLRGTIFEKHVNILNRPEQFKETHGLEYHFATRCRRCNKELTDPVSIETGLGPTCRLLE